LYLCFCILPVFSTTHLCLGNGTSRVHLSLRRQTFSHPPPFFLAPSRNSSPPHNFFLSLKHPFSSPVHTSLTPPPSALPPGVDPLVLPHASSSRLYCVTRPHTFCRRHIGASIRDSRGHAAFFSPPPPCGLSRDDQKTEQAARRGIKLMKDTASQWCPRGRRRATGPKARRKRFRGGWRPEVDDWASSDGASAAARPERARPRELVAFRCRHRVEQRPGIRHVSDARICPPSRIRSAAWMQGLIAEPSEKVDGDPTQDIRTSGT